MAITTITNSMVSVNAIQGTLIADNAITAVHIASNAVASIQIAENNITAREIAANTITVAQLADDCVESDKIADGVITTNHLNKAMISSQTEVTAVGGDFVLIGDTSDSNNLKKALVSDFGETNRLPLAGGNITGNLGIGQASPSAPLDLVTSSNVYAAEFTQSNTSNGDGVFVSVGSTAAADYALTVRSDAGNTSVLAAKADGKVGIGTFSPSHTLHVHSDNAKGFLLERDSGSNPANLNEYSTHYSLSILNRTSGSYLNFGGSGDYSSLQATDGAGTATAKIISLNPEGGAVGIGTTTPDTLLQVKSTGGGTELAFKITDNSGNSVYEQQGGGRAIFQYGPMLVAASTDIMHANMDDLQVGNAVGNRGLTIASGNGSYGTLAFADGSSGNAAYRGFVEYYHNDDSMRLGSGGVERIRVADNGKIIHKSYGSGDNIMTFIETQNSSDTGIAIGRNGTNNLKTGLRSSSNGSSSIFQIKLSLGESEGTQSISSPQFQFYHNGNLAITGSYSSDRRLKENIVDIPDGSTAFIKQLNPVSFNMIGSTVTKAGFIAQDVEALKPSLINGGEVDEQGDEIMRGVDYFGILAHAVKTIQELEARIKVLEG